MLPFTQRIDQADWPAQLQEKHLDNIRRYEEQSIKRLVLYGGECSFEIAKTCVLLYSLQVARPVRNRGIGTRLLNEVKAVARHEHKPILLTFSPEEGSEDLLRRFYRRHGFRLLSDNATMKWAP